jgi:hypothetical protein
LKSVGDVARETSRRKEDYVNPHLIPSSQIPMGHSFGGGRNPAQPVLVDRLIQRFCAFAVFYLDKCKGVSPPDDQIDFTA